METNFFKGLKELKIEGKWYLLIKMNVDEQKRIAAILVRNPAGDETRKMMPPILLEGSAEDLDERFFPSIGLRGKKPAEQEGE